jgi:hypothetical protein
MTKIWQASAAAAILMVAMPAVAQQLLLDVNTTVPMASTMDNPCTAEPETIVFQGSTKLMQRVWLLPSGNLRLQISEQTALEGFNSAAPLLGPTVKYVVSGDSENDLEFEPLAFSLLKFKKVNGGSPDEFHSVLVLDFDPQNLKLNLSLEPACDNGMP